MNVRWTAHALLLPLVWFAVDRTAIPAPLASVPPDKPRLMVLTDIGGDPDDQQSMIRLMVYANEFEIEGLIATASGTPGELKEKVIKPHLIREIVEAYGKVRDRLTRHADGYPTAPHLLERIKSGNPQRGLKAIGEGHDTEGSRWIIAVTDRPDPRPVNITVWGGQTDLAQALWRVRQERGADGLNQFIGKLRIYDIADQDGIADWILKEFPGLFYVLSQAPKGRDKRESVFRGLYLGGDESLVSRDWMEIHIRQSHGSLGALYPPRTSTAPNPHSASKEGDTPSWFYFLPNGLSDPAHPEWGGWGGRFRRERDQIFRDAHDTVNGVTDARCTVWRWRPAFQADFQAHLDWCVADEFAKANHPPRAVLNGDQTKNVLRLEVKSGETITLSAANSTDSDGDALRQSWFVYPEAGTFRGEVTLIALTGEATGFVAPTVQKRETVHVILQVQDAGNPNLFSHRRAIVTIKP